MQQHKRFGAAMLFGIVALVIMGSACGSSPTGPGNVPPPVTNVLAVDGLSGAPVPDAIVTLNGKAQKTDGSGRTTFDSASTGTTAIDINADGYRLFQQKVSSDGVYHLWPRKGIIDDAFTNSMTYTECVGMITFLTRPMYLDLAPELRNNPAVLDAFRRAAAATSGELRVTMSVDDRPPNAIIAPVVIGAVFDDEDGLTGTVSTAGIIEGAGVTLRNAKAATYRLAHHELWHAAGACHNHDADGLMNPKGSAADPNARELAFVRMRSKRAAGNGLEDRAFSRQ